MKWQRVAAGEYRAGAWTVRRCGKEWEVRSQKRGVEWPSSWGLRPSMVAARAFAEALAGVHGRE